MATTYLGYDYSTARPRPSKIAEAGRRFVVRYIGAGSTGKHLTRNEAIALTAAGLSIVNVCEGFERDAIKGRAEGVRQANLCLTNLGQVEGPRSRPVYFAVDWDASLADLDHVRQFLEGAASVLSLGMVGVYGGYRTIDYCFNHTPARWFWQTYAWSGGKQHRANNMYQYHNGATIDGGDVDLDYGYGPDFGGWQHGTSSLGSAPPPPPAGIIETPWDWARFVGYTGDSFNTLAATIEGSARQLEAGF